MPDVHCTHACAHTYVQLQRAHLHTEVHFQNYKTYLFVDLTHLVRGISLFLRHEIMSYWKYKQSPAALTILP